MPLKLITGPATKDRRSKKGRKGSRDYADKITASC